MTDHLKSVNYVCDYLKNSGIDCVLGISDMSIIDGPSPYIMTIYRDNQKFEEGVAKTDYNMPEGMYKEALEIKNRSVIVVCCNLVICDAVLDYEAVGWFRFSQNESVLRKTLGVPRAGGGKCTGWFIHETLLQPMEELLIELGKKPPRYSLDMEYSEYRKTPEFQKFREFVFFHYGKRCVLCGARDKLDVHHSTYTHLMGEFDVSGLPKKESIQELVVLCRTCHIYNTKDDNPRLPKLPKSV